MTQDERWTVRYNEVKTFIEENHRNPSKYADEERNMLNWLKATRKKLNASTLKPDRIEMFSKLLELTEKYKHVNQWV